MKILLTRPEPGASATAARLLALGFEPLLSPCLTITPHPTVFPEHFAAMIITSLQAIPALPSAHRDVPVFCVGDATAGRLREAGFSSVESAGGNADDLARLIIRRRLAGPHVMAVGQRQGLALARQLRASGMTVLRRIVYAARPIKTLPDDVRLGLETRQIKAALFYSSETARAFVKLSPPCIDNVKAFALSDTVGLALTGLPWQAIHVALAPTEADLLALLT